MIYTLEEIDNELKSANNSLAKKFIGVEGKIGYDIDNRLLIYNEDLKIHLDDKVKEYNVIDIDNNHFFFGYVNEFNKEGRKYLEGHPYANGLKDASFNPFMDGLEGFLGDQMKQRERDVEAFLKDCWKNKGKVKAAVICPQNGRVFRDLKTGINFKREDEELDSKYFDFEIREIPFYQARTKKKNKELLEDFIEELNTVDRKEKDLVIVIRGGIDMDFHCIFDDAEAYAAIASMNTMTACAVGHTDEHENFKNYSDHHEETPSLLGVSLGNWAEEWQRNS